MNNSTDDTTALDTGQSEAQREKRMLVVAVVLAVVVGAVCIWASFQPVQTSDFYGSRILTPLQVFTTLESHLSGPGCGAYLAAMQPKIERQYAIVSLPPLGVFEVHSHHFPSGLYTVRAVGPVNDRPDCRFDPLYRGPTI